MVDIKLFFFFAFLISISVSQDGPCSITTRADKYLKCRDKETGNSTNKVCCYLKMGDISRCVEIERLDIKGKDNFTATKNKILNGSYWNTSEDNYRVFNGTFSKIDTLRCNNSKYLKSFVYFAILFIFL